MMCCLVGGYLAKARQAAVLDWQCNRSSHVPARILSVHWEAENIAMVRSDNERDVIALYRPAMTVPDISALRGLTDKRIYYILKKHDVPLRPRRGVGKVLSAAQEAEIVVAYMGGTDAVRLAERYAVGSTTVYGVLQRAGVARRTNREIFRKLSDRQETAIVALYGRGLPASKITGWDGIKD